jgi:E3 ubiquitin-protein ligase MARCH6
MLGVRRQDEEGSHLRKTWKDWLLCKKAPASQASFNTLDKRTTSDVTFQKDGGFARVVAYDSVRIVPKCMFVRVNEDGSPLDDRGAQAIANQLSKGPNPEASFTIVYIPPRFKTRIFLFIYLLWFTGSIALFVAFTVPRKPSAQIQHEKG